MKVTVEETGTSHQGRGEVKGRCRRRLRYRVEKSPLSARISPTTGASSTSCTNYTRRQPVRPDTASAVVIIILLSPSFDYYNIILCVLRSYFLREFWFFFFFTIFPHSMTAVVFDNGVVCRYGRRRRHWPSVTLKTLARRRRHSSALRLLAAATGRCAETTAQLFRCQ